MKSFYKPSFFAHILCCSSLCGILFLSPAYGMMGEEDEWDTSSASSGGRRSVVLFSSEEQKKFQQALVSLYGGHAPSSRTPLPVGKIKVPAGLAGLFGHHPEEEVFIPVPQAPFQEVTSPAARESDNNNDNNNSLASPRLSLGIQEAPHNERKSAKSPLGEKSAFAEKIQDQQVQENTLMHRGLVVNEDNLAALFASPEELYDRLVSNFHGPHLILHQASFLNPNSLLIFDGLRYTRSVKKLSLSGSHLKTQDYLALSTLLAYNQSLESLDLRDVSWGKESLQLLGVALKEQKTLREILLRPKGSITSPEVKEFYRLIASNQGLRLIIWPEQKDIIKVIEEISNTNAPAALQKGVMYAEGILVNQDIKKAEDSFKKALQLGHAMAGYELGQLKERGSKNDEAFQGYLKSANIGFAPAQYKVSEYHRGVWPKEAQKEPDYKEAYSWCKKAANQGHGEALYRLGRMHQDGRFVEKSLDWAGHYFYQAVERGEPDAFASLGALYINPDYKDRNPETSQYYLIWATRFPKVAGIAQRFL